MKKIAILLTLILTVSLIFCSCAGSKNEETTAPETTSSAPVFEESTYETESVFAPDDTTAEQETTASETEEISTFSVG